MLKFIEKHKRKSNDNWECFIFKQPEANMKDRYFWACAFNAFCFDDGWKGSFKLPGDKTYRNEHIIPENFYVWRMKGECKALKCEMEFLYFSDGKLQLNVKNNNTHYDEDFIIDYMSVMFENRHYIKGFEDGYHKCENDFLNETGITTNEAKSMFLIKPSTVNQ